MPTVFVTGANRGLGLEFARHYASDGWRVIATSRSLEKAGELRALGARVALYQLDVADVAAVSALARTLAGESIDLLIANAGVAGPRGMTAEAIDADGWSETFRVNAIAPLALAGAFLAQVAKSGERKMIAITSRLGSIGVNSDGGMYAYRSSKAALNAAWHSFAIDHPEIVAALLHPGWVRTDMGGKAAPLSVADSIAGMRRVIAGLERKDSGGFFGYDGAPIPW
jgi:NAD(P)-dependent dehydrogenase (short-subunit alcohol dehydrogenase family)